MMKNKPFSYRKDFSDLDDSSSLYLKRISTLLGKYPHITADEYFAAPYKVYPHVEYFALEYFAGAKAIAAYSLYMKQLQEMPPDSAEQLDFIKRSLKYIGSFCVKNKIKLEEYQTSKTGVTYDWMKHVKKHEISVYVLMEFPKIGSIIKEAATDEKELFLGDVGTHFWGYKTKYTQSHLAKQLVSEGIKKIKNIVNN